MYSIKNDLSTYVSFFQDSEKQIKSWYISRFILDRKSRYEKFYLHPRQEASTIFVGSRRALSYRETNNRLSTEEPVKSC